MNIEEFRKAGYAAIDAICDYYSSLDEVHVTAQVEPGYLAKLIPDHAPDQGEKWEDIAKDFQRVIMPGITHWQHPNTYFYFPANVTYESILGELMATSVSNPGFNWACSPACTELENVVMDWAAKLFGLDETFLSVSRVGGGIIQGSASEAAIVAVIAARERALRLLATALPDTPATTPGELAAHTRAALTGKLVLYATTQTHSLAAKAALILGLEFRALEVSKEDGFALRGETLRSALEEDKRKGKVTFCLIATVGTTSSGAVDRLDEVGEVARDYPHLYIHVDAAWAGVTLSCPEYRERAQLDSINKYAHSFSTNLHKWGLVNFDAALLWVRDRRLLTDALDVTPEFLRTKHGDAGTVIDYRNWQLSLGRRFRSLKVWFVLRSFGVTGFQAHIRKGVALGQVFLSCVQQDPRFEICAPPSWALTVVRLNPDPAAKRSADDLNKLNQHFYALLTARHDMALTQTKLHDTFCIRFVVGAPRTQERHVRQTWERIRETADRAIADWEKGL